jgi:hypothetical protein
MQLAFKDRDESGLTLLTYQLAEANGKIRALPIAVSFS